MTVVTTTTQLRGDVDEVFTNYQTVQRDGAGTSSYDDYIATKKRTDEATRTTPLTPLFVDRLPAGDPSTPPDVAATVQIADNNIKATFFGVVQWLQGKLPRDIVLVGTRVKTSVSVSTGNLYVTLSGTGLYPQSTGPGVVGVPVNVNPEAQYVEIRSASSGAALTVASGGHAGERIFGLTRTGSSTSPNSVEVEFRSRSLGSAVSAGNAYTWESSQPATVNFRYPFRMALSSADETAFRRVLE